MYQGNYLAERISRTFDGQPDAHFLTHHVTGQTVPYKTFFANAERIAAALVNAGVLPGDRVAIQAPKTISMLELYVACVLTGAVFLPLNPAYTPQEVTYFLGDAKPGLFVCDPEKQNTLAKIAKACEVKTVWTLDADENGSLKDARDTETSGFSAVSRGPEDLAAILYTSGTTGRSKGAMLTHRALASNSEVLKDYWHFDASDVLIHALPIFHTHGLFVATNITLMAGGSMIFMPKFDADKVLEAMPRATALMGVPTFYTRILECDGLQAAARDMRLFVSGSAPLLAETHDRWRAETGHAILERYGMTETNMNTSNPYDGDRRAGTVGFPLPGVELIITDPATGKPLGLNEIGILEVRGDNVFSGYWKMPEKTAEELRENGFFITGDLGKIDEDGYVHIVGRSKDLIITGGFNVYPKEVETLIDDLPGVTESAVIGVPHPDFGEAVVAIIVPENGDLETTAISTALSDSLAKFKQPKKIIQLDTLPRNTMGKVQKAELRKTYGSLFT